MFWTEKSTRVEGLGEEPGWQLACLRKSKVAKGSWSWSDLRGVRKDGVRDTLGPCSSHRSLQAVGSTLTLTPREMGTFGVM